MNDAEPISPLKPTAERNKNSRTTKFIGSDFRLTKLIALAAVVTLALLFAASPAGSRIIALFGFDEQIDDNAEQLLSQGRQTFRFDTFGDEAFWGGMLQLHRAIEGAQFGGVGPGVSPNTALAVGLKVDSDALPQQLIARIKQGRVNLDDPATTLALLRLNAVLGVKGFFESDGSLQAVGITCALCHSTVDNSFAPGIGHRL